MAQKVIRINQLASTPAKAAKSNKAGQPVSTKSAKVGLLPVSPATVWRWVREGKFPKPFKLGTSVTVWDLDQVEAFIAQRARDAQE
ncbi:helix-turn-helix transcriptional regulator [Massilia sp. TWR1-2-2]|uniref:helix-turn-helix transcriptional regulator n=1 Tax=Massilia sp. TWR1-2-2 TaxID=2804584 RepID=UPI003CF02A0A